MIDFCLQCGKDLKNKRKDAKYCSPECKARYNYIQKKKKKRKEQNRKKNREKSGKSGKTGNSTDKKSNVAENLMQQHLGQNDTANDKYIQLKKEIKKADYNRLFDLHSEAFKAKLRGKITDQQQYELQTLIEKLQDEKRKEEG